LVLVVAGAGVALVERERRPIARMKRWKRVSGVVVTFVTTTVPVGLVSTRTVAAAAGIVVAAALVALLFAGRTAAVTGRRLIVALVVVLLGAVAFK
jgi:hypothetical protein